LHLGIEVLDTEAHAVETDAAQLFHYGCVYRARVHLDRVVPFGGEFKPATDSSEECPQPTDAVKTRRATAPVHPDGARIVPEKTALKRDLPVQAIEIFLGLCLVPRHDLVAGAVVADVAAKREMDVKRQRTLDASRIAPGDCCPIGIGPEDVDEAVCSRIRRVARSRSIESTDQL